MDLVPTLPQVYEALTPIAPKGFSVAAAFGNVHGVYSPGNVKLTPTVSSGAGLCPLIVHCMCLARLWLWTQSQPVCECRCA